ncbi:MAG: carbamoyl-phosphate synthase large subunit [Burkholderiales bacterium]|nr:carbamoyl-phosphate synthase large subunit [Burkholderiales bacterium]
MFEKVLVANRGEIAVRIIRACKELNIRTVAVYSEVDANSMHVQLADEAICIGKAPASDSYLRIDRIVSAAEIADVDAIHPGYGFLSENAHFAEVCESCNIRFIGPSPRAMNALADKAVSRALAKKAGVETPPGSEGCVEKEQDALAIAKKIGYPVMIKAVAGGGGRGMRLVADPAQLPAAYERCRAEAKAAFGIGEVYAERLIARARHLEVQVIGDGRQVMALGERDCTLQRRFQKLVEIAPAPGLAPALRERLAEAALTLARAAAYRSLGTFEFLVDEQSADLPFVFIEANPRLQVEHTVTEAVTGIDLVQAQIAVAAGRSLAALGLDPEQPPRPRGFAVQWRINAETLDEAGQARPAGGTIAQCEWPQGPGIRIDSQAFVGLTPSPQHDSLLAKLVVWHAGRFDDALRRSQRALAECRIDGLGSNLGLLRALAQASDLHRGEVHTRWLEAHWPALRESIAAAEAAARTERAADAAAAAGHAPGLAALATATTAATPAEPSLPPGQTALRAPLAGRIVQWSAAEGEVLAAQAEALVLEAMKMQHGVALPAAARLVARYAAEGEFVAEGQLLARLEPVDAEHAADAEPGEAESVGPRADLQRVLDRRALTLDAARPEAMTRRHAAGGQSARENIAQLCDAGSFTEYGAFAIAAQTRRRPLDDLVRNTPADGMVTGIGSVNGAEFGPERSRCAVLAYDYTVLAGTQGWRNHHKKDRLLDVIHRLRLPTVLFAEGGGGRPGDVDMPVVAGLNNHTFSRFAALSGKVPFVGVVHGRCFAGNAALLGCADVIIATKAANIGMGGPAMIEGGGLGVYRPEEIGPAAELARCGVVDLLVEDERAAVDAARRYLAYFQGRTRAWSAADPRTLRRLVPENRQRVYDMRAVLAALADTGSVLELRAGFGAGMITALARFEGRPVGVFANDPRHLGGAIDPEAADKAARFMRLCDTHGLPLLSLCDTPGFMVGPEVERQAQVRHACRMFVAAARLAVPCFMVVVRKGYGLGAQAMAVGGFDAPVFNVAWPTGEFGAMGLEGAVRLGFRKELEAAAAGAEREALYRKLVEQQYANGSALNMAATLEIDAVIDPTETRDWLLRGLDSAAATTAPAPAGRLDTW